jgi:Ca-activated chloride channel family protein
VSFLAAQRLWLLIVPVVVLGIYLIARRRANTHAVRFTNLELLDKVAPNRPGVRRHLPIALVMAALVLLGLAAARPVTTVLVPTDEATVMLLIDTSISMDANDVEPTRLDAAKAAALEFIANVPDEVRLGVVSFSGTVRLMSPPTQDRAETADAIQAMQLGEGTAIGEAIFEGLRVIESDAARITDAGDVLEAPAATILVLSDGVTTVGRPDESAVTAAVDRGIPISTISFGSGSGQVTYAGQTIPVPVNDTGLETIAAQTGGQFFDADTAADLQAVFDTLETQVGRVEETREVADLFGIAALLVAALGAGLGLWWFARIP